MAALPPAEIVDAVLSGLYESGAQACLTSQLRTHPRTFQVTFEGRTFILWVYIWTVTHGGATRSPDEYRIQMTTVKPPLQVNPNGQTLLLGWNPEHKVFAGFDLQRHRTFRPGSNSVQISLKALLEAENFSWGFYQNQYNEIAVAFRPPEMMNYALNASALHADGALAADLLNRLAKMEPVPKQEIEAMPARRRRIVQTMTKFVRASGFRDQVISAYQQRCAVTRVQLNLLDAAHIYPVDAEDSTDVVSNGICLSPTYHRAFDRGLVYLSEDCKMVLNNKRMEQLKTLDLVGGLDYFCQHLGQPIFLPVNPDQRPKLDFIRKANRLRLTRYQ